ncbi:hypothetical protein [Bordetella sp. LUAb4]|uniref:hypothetical protein n=1 Tax=Bordetella sp. LUAb4 TaxID=2843195 RepID=UPI001E50C7E6|nr:hypothetical protein [Bordetella sp. LUAb4]
MSLDFILIKSRAPALSMDDVDVDDAFKQDNYRELAERLFGPVTWTVGGAIAARGKMSFELSLNDVSLSVTARGPGDTVAFMDNIVTLALQEGIVTIDVQSSEVLLPLSD